jgi:hypothetical protein
LNVSPGLVPHGPAQPDFDPALASSRPRVSFTTATLVDPTQDAWPVAQDPYLEDPNLRSPQPGPHLQPDSRRDNGLRSSKFFIELHEEKPAPVISPQGRVDPPARRPARPEAKPQAKAPSNSARPIRQRVAEKFGWKRRRILFIVLVILTILGANISVWNYVHGRSTPFGFGPATEIEVVTQELNVHAEPRTRGKILGSIAKGNKYHVIEQPNQNWLLIDVNQQWNKKALDNDADQGWIYGDLDGNSPYVRVVSRKFWWR